MKRHLLTAASAAVLATLFATAAGAATSIQFVGYQTALNPGETLVTNFDSPVSTAPGFVLSGTGTFQTGSDGDGAAPAFSPLTRDETQYLSILGGQFELLSTPLLRSISFYIGSLDTYNTIRFTSSNGVESFSGGDLEAAVVAYAEANGNQQSINSNGRYTFTFDTGITGVRLESTTNSFELSDIGATAVPEPATWAMMIGGFGGVGTLIRFRRRQGYTPA